MGSFLQKCEMRIAEKNKYWGADQRRFSGFNQAKNTFRHLSAQIWVSFKKNNIIF